MEKHGLKMGRIKLVVVVFTMLASIDSIITNGSHSQSLCKSHISDTLLREIMRITLWRMSYMWQDGLSECPVGDLL